MIEIKKLNESWIHLSGDHDELLSIKEHFKFRPANYQWNPKYKSGIWSGWIFLMDRQNRLPIGLYMRLKKLLKMLNIEYTNNFVKTSVNISDDAIVKYSKEVVELEHNLRDYQIEAIRESFKQQKAVVLSPTASGKSAILFFVYMLFMKLKPASKVLLIVPNISLVDQMRGDFLEYSENMETDLDNNIHIIYSGKEKVPKIIEIETEDNNIYEFDSNEIIIIDIDNKKKKIKAKDLKDYHEINNTWLSKQKRK